MIKCTHFLFAVWAETGDFRDAPHSHNTSMDHNQTTSFLHGRNNRMRDRKGNVVFNMNFFVHIYNITCIRSPRLNRSIRIVLRHLQSSSGNLGVVKKQNCHQRFLFRKCL